MKIEKPKLQINGKEIEMLGNAGTAQEILKFSNDRKKLSVENFLESHIKMVAKAFGVSAEEVSNSITLAEVVETYLKCLEYVARVIYNVANGDNGDGENKDAAAVV